MTVPIQIPWDLYHGKVVVWCECVAAGVKRAVLLPRLDTIFGPVQEDPAREVPYDKLDWRLISPTEADWERYRRMVETQAERAGITFHAQRVENVAEWVAGRRVAVPQFHFWLYRDDAVRRMIERLYDEPDPRERRRLWQWLLAWTAPAVPSEPYE